MLYRMPHIHKLLPEGQWRPHQRAIQVLSGEDYRRECYSFFFAEDRKLERCKPHEAARHLTKCDVIKDVKLFPTVSQDILLQIFDVI